MISYKFTKTVNSLRLQEEIITAGLSAVLFINTEGSAVEVVFSSELDNTQLDTLATVVSAHQVLTTREYVRSLREDAIEFGCTIMNDFIEENIMLGITQANMTNVVRKRLREVKDALCTGSLKDAIYELKAIPAEDKDGTFINNVRILAVINKIEVYLGLPLTESL